MDCDPSQETDPDPKPATVPPSGGPAASAGDGSGTLPEVGGLGALLREIRDRLPPPAASPPRPGLWRSLDAKVRAVEPWGVLLATFGLFLALIAFWVDYRDQVDGRTVRAWQLLTTPASGNSGKREALEYLNREDGLLCFERLRGRLAWLHGDKEVSCLIFLKGRSPLTGIDLSPPDRMPDDPNDDPPGAYLVDADLAGANLAGADLADANLERADLTGADLREADLAGANLRHAGLADANLVDANFAGADLMSADLTEADLQDASLAGAFLRNADLTRANLERADFTGADMYDAGLAGAYLVDADLAGAFLRDADLTDAFLWRADLAGANLAHADLTGATLAQADLTGADLGGADLTGANLSADLAGANLGAANFTETFLSGAHFTSEEAGAARNLTQVQIDRAWAWADHPPTGLDRLAPPLALRLCDPALRDAWTNAIEGWGWAGRWPKPPAGCSGAAGAGAAARSGGG